MTAILMRLPRLFVAATSMRSIWAETRRLAVRSSPWWVEAATPWICHSGLRASELARVANQHV